MDPLEVLQHRDVVPIGQLIDDHGVLLMLEEGDELGELGSPAEGTEDVASPTEHDPSNLRTRGAVQALEHGSAERVDPALAGLVRNRSVDRLDRRVRPRDRAHADRRDRSVMRPGRRMEEREEPRPRVVLGSDRPFAISNERNGVVRYGSREHHGLDEADLLDLSDEHRRPSFKRFPGYPYPGGRRPQPAVTDP